MDYDAIDHIYIYILLLFVLVESLNPIQELK